MDEMTMRRRASFWALCAFWNAPALFDDLEPDELDRFWKPVDEDTTLYPELVERADRERKLKEMFWGERLNGNGRRVLGHNRHPR